MSAHGALSGEKNKNIIYREINTQEATYYKISNDIIRRVNLMTEYVNNMKYRKYHIVGTVSKSH
jgi:hypothetical protein